MTISVFAPASIGNVSVGFDILGLAVKPLDGTLLGDVVSIEAAAENTLLITGEFANKLPKNPTDNIVWDCLNLYNAALEEIQEPIQKVKLTLEKKMPVGSGLGSSACSVVAALVALNEFNEKIFNDEKMLFMMGQMEAQISGSLHYDNVAPCYFGGLQLMVPDQDIVSRTLPHFDDCYYVMAYPGINVSTKSAREALPATYSLSDVIAFGQNLATFIDACHRDDKEEAFSVVKDVLAEPYRQHLLPKFEAAKTYLVEQGHLAVGISGSGPTLFCVCRSLEAAQDSAFWLQKNYVQTDLGFVHVCQADINGATVITHE